MGLRQIGSAGTFGSGDNANFYSADLPPISIDVRKGTAGAPDTASGPLVKASRTIAHTEAAIEAIGGAGADGAEQLAAIAGINIATVAAEVQPVGVLGAAKTASTSVGHPGNDACGVYGTGRATGAAIGTAIGGFFLARRDTATARANAMELNVYNGTATVDAYNSSGFQQTSALWINANGGADSAAGIVFGNAFGRQFDVGIGFTSQGAGSIGGVKTAAYRDDSKAATSVLINGTHATAAIGVKAGAGPVVVGRDNGVVNPGVLFEVYASAPAGDLAAFQGNAGTDAIAVKFGQGAASMRAFVAGAANQYVTGSAQGDSGFNFSSTKVFHIGPAGATSAIRVNSTGVALNGNAPVAKAAAIVAPTAPSAGYVQAEAASMKTAIDAIRTALTNVGITA